MNGQVTAVLESVQLLTAEGLVLAVTLDEALGEVRAALSLPPDQKLRALGLMPDAHVMSVYAAAANVRLASSWRTASGFAMPASLVVGRAYFELEPGQDEVVASFLQLLARPALDCPHSALDGCDCARAARAAGGES